MGKHRLNLHLALALLAGGISSGCNEGTDPAGGQTSTVEPAEHRFEITCRESAQMFAVDPATAAGHVPGRHNLFITSKSAPDATRHLPEGQAVFILIYQECSNATFDGVNYAPAKMLHAWIRIEGPPEVLPVPGASTTVPTYYWYMLDDQTTHEGLRAAFRNAGIESSPVHDIVLGHDQDGVRKGRVTERKMPLGGGDIAYEFVEHNKPVEQVPIGINHRLFREHCPKGGQCTRVQALDSGFIVPFGSGSQVTVTAHPKSLVGRLWGTRTLQGLATQFEHMEFTVKISSGIPLQPGDAPPG